LAGGACRDPVRRDRDRVSDHESRVLDGDLHHAVVGVSWGLAATSGPEPELVLES